MKIFESTIIVILIICVSAFCQKPPAENLKDQKEIKTKTLSEEIKTDTLSIKEKGTSSDVDSAKTTAPPPDESDFVNPFATGDEEDETVLQDEIKPEETPDTISTPFLSEDQTEEDAFDEAGGGFDFLVDLGVGLSLPRFEVEPNNISTEGKPSFIFNGGLVVPFAKWFYAGVSLRYLQLSFDLLMSDSQNIDIDSVDYYFEDFNTKEKLAFISVPIQLGMRFELGLVTPYFYADIEPAFLTGGHQFCVWKSQIFFKNGDIDKKTYNSDIGLTDKREQFQIFVGGGAGIEVSYGYGALYLDGSVQYAPKQIDKSGYTQGVSSLPARSSCKAIYFPVSIGIRFYL
jgi:hypothetical protein